MAKIHDKYIIELAEVIKGYGNDPDVKDPFRLSEFYRFYELPEIAVSRQHFEKMQPLKQTAVPWEFLERYADWFCAYVSFPEFIREARMFYEDTYKASEGGTIS